MRIAIIGGGLAGCAAAYVLKQRGHEPVIYESSQTLASGASGNEVGLYNPRFTAEFNAEGQFYSAAFFLAIKTFENLANINWKPCGALHLLNDVKKVKRFPQTLENWNWGEDDMRIVGALEASDISGIDITQDALYLPRSGIVSPRKLCEAYAQGIEVVYGQNIEDLTQIKADAIILAGGMGVQKFESCKNIPLKPVRGQITYAKATEDTKRLSCTIGFGGYIAPSINGVHCVGSTFQPWLDHSDIIEQDDADNIEKLGCEVPSLRGVSEITDHRAAVRTTSKDHFPIIGQVSDNIYVSTAHGSHGILSAIMGAEILVDMFDGRKPSVSENVLAALSPHRF